MKRLYSATQNSIRGLVDGFKTEAALRDEALLVVAGLLFAVVIAPSSIWYAAMIGALLVVLAVEFLNTAIEKLADHVTREQHSEIRRIKDFGSAAVFCSLGLAGLVWLTAAATGRLAPSRDNLRQSTEFHPLMATNRIGSALY